MPKRKTDGLLAEISEMEPATPSQMNWYQAMARERPEDYAQMVEVLKDYFRGGHTATVFPSLARLHRFLAGEDPRSTRAILSVGCTSFVAFARRVQHGQVEA